jgi:hypothetical protein
MSVPTAFFEQPNPLCNVLSTHYIITTNFHKLIMNIRGAIVLKSQKTIARPDLVRSVNSGSARRPITFSNCGWL